MRLGKIILIFSCLILAAPVHAAEVTLLWSADTYKPALYAGHSLATPGSTVHVAAMIDGVSDVSGINFRWWKDGQFLSRSSGAGASTLIFTAGDNGVNNINLRLNTGDGTALGEANVQIPVVAPRITIYQNEPLTGVSYHRAVSDGLQLQSPEIALVAEPYYFPKAEAGKLDWLWQLNGSKVTADPTDGRLITFAAPGGTSGQSQITAQASSPTNLLQTAKKVFAITFGVSNNFNF